MYKIKLIVKNIIKIILIEVMLLKIMMFNTPELGFSGFTEVFTQVIINYMIPKDSSLAFLFKSILIMGVYLLAFESSIDNSASMCEGGRYSIKAHSRNLKNYEFNLIKPIVYTSFVEVVILTVLTVITYVYKLGFDFEFVDVLTILSFIAVVISLFCFIQLVCRDAKGIFVGFVAIILATKYFVGYPILIIVLACLFAIIFISGVGRYLRGDES